MKTFKKEDLIELMSLYQNKEVLANADGAYDHAAVTAADKAFLTKCEEMDITVAQGRAVGWQTIVNFDQIKVADGGSEFEFEVVA